MTGWEKEPSARGRTFGLQVTGWEVGLPAGPGVTGQPLVVHTTRGDVRCLFHPAAPARLGIVWVWGTYGGFDGPADSIYGVLAEELSQEGIASLRVDYRMPNVIHESVSDTLAGISTLTGLGVERIALVGHSFGGAVVIAAAPLSPQVTAVVALSSQTAGAQNAAQVSPRPLLLIHGTADRRLPSSCSELIYGWAREPKELVLLEGAGHGLREAKDRLHALLKRWLMERLQAS